MMSEAEEDRRKILRVVEVDPQKLTDIDNTLRAVQLEQERLRSEAAVRSQTTEKIAEATEKLDEAVRGNGKEGLNQKVGKLEGRFDGLETKLDELLDSLKDSADFALRLNTGKFRTIAQEEIKKALEAPGGWMEFRKSWLFPVALSIIMAIIGGLIGKYVF
jgi:uncharacterized protein Yka (UPF0111/DUF47 family)